MERVFVETSLFRTRLDKEGGDWLLRKIQSLILDNPLEGDTIAGTGGIRKMRVENPRRNKGKRGGYRVLYLDLPDKKKTYLIALYSKGEKEDVTADEKKVLKELVDQLKAIGVKK